MRYQVIEINGASEAEKEIVEVAATGAVLAALGLSDDGEYAVDPDAGGFVVSDRSRTERFFRLEALR